eukprot:CAMPEP_0194717242 /NCGR_PEP_ID=MMETSP0296-20130528/8912_1 /TAXON_ID=39354 /ORGANISM="Heterosigma akashiwo, Strain CCMP2393" /LENGTH=86 /DNA_ID=CAMNT_0039618019 /DNA_START=473 /DNA_END=730 /DNA_ORIENTATION=+
MEHWAHEECRNGGGGGGGGGGRSLASRDDICSKRGMKGYWARECRSGGGGCGNVSKASKYGTCNKCGKKGHMVLATNVARKDIGLE